MALRVSQELDYFTIHYELAPSNTFNYHLPITRLNYNLPIAGANYDLSVTRIQNYLSIPWPYMQPII